MSTAGIRHIFNATQYSVAGLIVLLREKAARLEVGMLVGSVAMLLLLNGRFTDYLVVALLFCVTFSVESTNTAIESLVDHLSPEKSDFARDTKDLGSTSVFFLLIANGLFLSAVFARFMDWVVW